MENWPANSLHTNVDVTDIQILAHHDKNDIWLTFTCVISVSWSGNSLKFIYITNILSNLVYLHELFQNIRWCNFCRFISVKSNLIFYH